MSNGSLERLATERRDDKTNNIILSLHSKIKHRPVLQKLAVTLYTTRYSVYRVYLSVVCGYENKQRLFPVQHLLTGFYKKPNTL
jgi:hypothetical protein